MKIYAVIAVVFICLAIGTEGKRKRKDRTPPSELVKCHQGCFHAMIDTVGSVNMSEPTHMFFSKKGAEETKFANDLDAFKAVCDYYPTLEKCDTDCKPPTEKVDRQRLGREAHMVHTLKAICGVFKQDILNNWNCMIKLKQAASTQETCKKCAEDFCNPTCLEDCVQPLEQEQCEAVGAVDLMRKIAVYFSKPRIEFILKWAQDEQHKAQMPKDDVECLPKFQEFVDKYKDSTQ